MDETNLLILMVIFTVFTCMAICGLMGAGWEPCWTTNGYQFCAPR